MFPSPLLSLGCFATSGLTKCAYAGFGFVGAEMLIGILGPTLSLGPFLLIGWLYSLVGLLAYGAGAFFMFA